MPRLRQILRRATAVFIEIAEPILRGDIAFFRRLLELGERPRRIGSDAIAMQIHQAEIARRFHVSRLRRLFKQRPGRGVIGFLVGGDAAIKQRFCLRLFGAFVMASGKLRGKQGERSRRFMARLPRRLSAFAVAR